MRNKIRTMVVTTLLLTLLCAMVAPAAAYNRYAAENYAETYALNPNPAYRYFGEDCTNFVSQCLYAGGLTETGKYWYGSDYAWYYDWGTRPGYSHTWTVANELYDFLDKSGRASRVSVDAPYCYKFDPGDIIQIDSDNDGWWDHSMIVTGEIVSDDDLLMSYHTTNTLNERLSDIRARNQNAHFGGWHIH